MDSSRWSGGSSLGPLGPFGMNHLSVSVKPKLPSKRPAQEGGEGRKATRHKERMNTIKEQLHKRLSENQQSCAVLRCVCQDRCCPGAPGCHTALCRCVQGAQGSDSASFRIWLAGLAYTILGNVDEMKELIAEYNLMRNKRMPDPPEPPSKIESVSLQSSTDKMGCSSNSPRN
eukprot:4561216-Pleurochrysis_carterae.AAC.1